MGEENGRAFKGLGLDLIKRSVRCNPNRERRENRESLYDLFLFVCTLRVVRGSWNSKGVSTIDSNRERREKREQKKGLSVVASDLTKRECPL